MKSLYCIVGPSGSGKTSAQLVLEKIHQLDGVWSYTTRPPRYEDEAGHFFVLDYAFNQLGPLVAYTEYNGYRYGVTAELLDRADFYVIDPAGVATLKENYHNKPIKVIWLDTTETERAIRMLNRGDCIDKVYERIQFDREAFSGEWMDKIFEMADGHIQINTNGLGIRQVAYKIKEYMQSEGDYVRYT